MIKSTTIVFAMLAGLGGTLSVQASDNLRVRLLASTCANCHGPGGHSLGAIPSIAGQEKDYLQVAMLEQRSGERETTVMRKYMNGYTAEEIALLAEYFSKQK